ncbi:MAG: hypothetical protein RIC89_05095, partial [Pseudomonadales bacterium]
DPVDASQLATIEERLRQERETFDQRKEQEGRWFSLRLRMGYTAVVLLPTVAIICGYILLNSNTFPAAVVTSAGAALFVDILGLVAAVFKLVFHERAVTKLEPVTEQLNNSDGTSLD